MKVFRFDGTGDELEAVAPVEQDDQLRRLVDCLPQSERNVVSRMFFGGASVVQVMRETGLSRSKVNRLSALGLRRLRGWIEDPRSAPKAEPKVLQEPQRRHRKGRCTMVTEWGKCRQPEKADALCALHLESVNRGFTPEPGYEREVVEGRRVPVEAKLSPVELETLVNGRYRGDGRRLDAYATHFEPLGYEP